MPSGNNDNYGNNQEETELLRGTVKRVTFRNAENGYSVLKVSTNDSKDLLTVTGNCPDVSTGSNIIAEGEYLVHPRFGKQFNAKTITQTIAETPDAVASYLGSGIFKGIGEKTAKTIATHFGKETLKILSKNPERINEVPGIGPHKAQLLINAISQQSNTLEVQRFLVEHNLSLSLSQRIMNKYGIDSVKIVSSNPYALAHDLKGVGFATADTIALNLGFAPHSAHRLKAGIFWALEKAADDGHCYLPLHVISEKVHQLLGLEDRYDLSPLIEELSAERYIVLEDESVYIRQIYEAEEFCASFVIERLDVPKEPYVPEKGVQSALREAEKDLKITLSAEQQEAVRKAASCPLLLITGGPGCGKTTVIRALSALFDQAGKTLALAAPTGKAAQRMSEICNKQAKTIHRLLKFDPVNQCFKHGPDCPISSEENPEEEIDAVIIDEASMIDIYLAKSLFSAIPRQTPLILVGDKDQLPSVGPGRVFAELLSIHEMNIISLSQLFRRSEESSINSIAHMINSGIIPNIPKPDGETQTDAYFIERRNPEEISSLIEKLVADQLPNKFGFELEDITVLSPSNRGPLGIETLNKNLQERLNSDTRPEDTFKNGNREFRLGDRVCQRRNNYNIDEYGVYNGDIGIVYEVDNKNQELTIDLWDGRLIKYDNKSAGELSLAYAMTIHRSQGSEIPCVVLALHDSHFILLERQLFYTAVTRAKKLLVVVGTKKALAMATKRITNQKRCTQLTRRIRMRLES